MNKKNDDTPRKYVQNLLIGCMPEKKDEILLMWEQYNPNVVVIENTRGIRLSANKHQITLNVKTMDVFWMIGFAGWKALECFSPLVLCSYHKDIKISKLIKEDKGLPEVEYHYKQRLNLIKNFISSEYDDYSLWPDDIPIYEGQNTPFQDVEHQAAYELTCMATCFTFLHEFRHVMLDADNIRPIDRREEELACDIWARDFFISKVNKYAHKTGDEFRAIISKRSMGLALATLIIHEITPFWEREGNNEYFSVRTRLKAVLENTPLPEDDKFWVFIASLLIGNLRKNHVDVDPPVLPPRELTYFLLNY